MSGQLRQFWVPCCVYAIFDGASHMPFYIGLTTQLESRISGHKCSHNIDVKNKMREFNNTLYVKVLSNHPNKPEGREAERQAILDYLAMGAPLLNRQKTKKPRDWTKPLNQQAK